MNRKSFLKRLLAGAVVAPVLPAVIAKATEAEVKTVNGCIWTPTGRIKVSSLDGPIEGQIAHVKIIDDYQPAVEMTDTARRLWDEACERLYNNIHTR